MGVAYGQGGWMLPVAWLTWLATGEWRMAVYGLRWLYGGLRFLHLVGAGSFLGTLLVLELHRIGLWPGIDLGPARKLLVRVLTTAFWTAVVSGLLLFLYDPLRIGLHSMFLPKLALVIGGYAYARWVEGALWVRRTGTLRRASAGLGAAIWLTVMGASTWNFVERPVSVTAQMRAATVGK